MVRELAKIGISALREAGIEPLGKPVITTNGLAARAEIRLPGKTSPRACRNIVEVALQHAGHQRAQEVKTGAYYYLAKPGRPRQRTALSDGFTVEHGSSRVFINLWPAYKKPFQDHFARLEKESQQTA